MSSKRSLILIDAAAIAGPLFVVLAARSLMSPAASMGGAPASPYENGSPVAVVAVAQRKLSPEQTKALDWISHIGSRANLTSPMDHPQLAAPVVIESHQEPDQPQTPTPEPAVNPLAGVKLTGIIGTSEGGLAAINGKIYKVGETVRPGLTLARIDAKANMIVLKSADGTEFTIRRRQQTLSDTPR